MLLFRSTTVAIVFLGVLLGSIISYAADDIDVEDNTGTRFSNDYDFREDLHESKQGKLELLWRARLYGESAKLETQSAEIGGIDLHADTKYRFFAPVEARVYLRGKFEAGRSQDFFGELEPGSKIYLREGAVKFTPVEFFELKAGVIDQDWMGMPLLTFRQSFPGFNVDLHHNWTENFQTGFNSQYLIPTSQSLSTRTVDQEATPSFKTQTLYGAWSDSTLTVRGSAGLYEYENLPSTVAFESQKRGNSYTIISGPNNSAFQFPFQGWFGNIGTSYRVTGMFEPFVYYSILKNQEAPESFNDGHVIGGGTKLHTNNIIYLFGYENFFAESDVVPGHYNGWHYGNTNKEGQGFEFIMQFKKQHFRLRSYYYEAKVINLDPLQQNQKYFYLGVETGYDRI